MKGPGDPGPFLSFYETTFAFWRYAEYGFPGKGLSRIFRRIMVVE